MYENGQEELKKRPSGNSFKLSEWAGAFGDLGTMIPFVIGYITILDIDPLGILLTIGVFLVASGFYYKTPMPVQPMKAIGGAAITQASLVTPNMVWSAGLITGLFWLIIGLSGALKYISKIVSKPVIIGIVVGLGVSFIMQGISMIIPDWIIALIALVLTVLLLSNKRIPAMFVLLIFGLAVTLIQSTDYFQEIVSIRPGFKLPIFALSSLSWNDVLTGFLILTIPQIPLTLGNAVIATTAENNKLFPDRPVSETKVALSKGLMNLISPVFGGVPVCHGAGGLVSNFRFGARTGGAVIIFGSLLILLGLFFSDSILLIFSMIPTSILGVILFFAGIELAMSVRDIGSDRKDIYVMIITIGFSLWNVGIGFIAGLLVQVLVRRKWFNI
jgi:MFS superfamily sulfate permease-like transporter